MFLFRVTVGNMIPEVKKYFTTYDFSLANNFSSKTDSSLIKCKPLKKRMCLMYVDSILKESDNLSSSLSVSFKLY